MTLETVQLGNSGFKIIVNVKDPAGAARDLTGATNLKIKLKSALSAGKEFAGVAENLALGQISYTVAAETDINATGVWEAQAYYELGAWKGHTEKVEAFYVEGNLA